MNDDLIVAKKVVHLLDESTEQLPEHIRQRLFAHAHNASLSVRKPKSADSDGFWTALSQKLGSGFRQPLLSGAFSLAITAVAVGLFVSEYEAAFEFKISELTALDAEILMDDLPPDAWIDTEFLDYNREWEAQQQRTGPTMMDLFINDAVQDGSQS